MKEYDIYSSKKIEIPKPELFVVYTGNRKEKPDEISLSEEFFNGEPSSIEIKIKMLYGKGDDILCQYVSFTKIFEEQVKLYGYSKKTIKETIRICKNKNILKEYLDRREKEVTDLFDILYDSETISRLHDAQLRRDAKEEGITQGESNTILSGLNGGSTPEEIASVLHIPLEKVLAVQKEMLEEV